MEDFTKLDGVHNVLTYDSITYEKTYLSVGTWVNLLWYNPNAGIIYNH